MKLLKLIIFGLLMAKTSALLADDSFRLEGGKLLNTGMSKPEVMALAGAPENKDVQRLAVDDGEGEPVKREVLTYRLRGSVGGMYLVVITVENNSVVGVNATQEGRL